MGYLSWIIVGAIAGWMSGQVMKGEGFGLVGNVLVGIAGGLLGGWIATSLLKWPIKMSGVNVTSVLVAFLGSIALIVVARLLFGRKRRRRR